MSVRSEDRGDDRITVAGGVTLRTHRWLVERPIATVALLHGYADHCSRYRHVAEALNRAQMAVVGVDLRGHGHSTGQRGRVDRFTDYHHDVDAILALAREVSAGAPVFLLGHSMGGLLACDFCLARPSAGVAGLVLSSPLFGVAVQASALKVALGHGASKLLPWLSLPSGLRGVDVCRDPQIARAYDADPLVFPSVNSRWYTEMLCAVERVFAGAGQLALPTEVLYGGADRVASADATDRLAARLTMADRHVERLEGHFHEVFNDLPLAREKVLAKVVAWLEAHSRSASSGAHVPGDPEQVATPAEG